MSGTSPLLAVAYGRDGVPTLFVPPSGPVPPALAKAAAALRPRTVEVMGSLTQPQIKAVVGDRQYVRAHTDDPTAVSWSAALSAADRLSTGIATMPRTVFAPAAVAAQAAAAVQLRDRFVVVTPQSGPLPPHSLGVGSHTEPEFVEPVAAIGGTSAISPARRVELLRGQHRLEAATYVDVAGADRYATAAKVARLAYPDGARTAYLASGTRGVDAAAAVSLPDGPLFLVPTCGPLPTAVADALREIRPERVAALGDATVVCDRILDAAAAATTVRPEGWTATDIALHDTRACLVAEPGTVQCWDLTAPYEPLGGVAAPSAAAPRDVPGFTGPVDSVTAGIDTSMCAISRERQLWCWGSPLLPRPDVAQPVTGAPSGITDYQGTADVGCAIATDGVVWCHTTSRGATGATGATVSRMTPAAGLPRAQQLAMRPGLSCLLSTDSDVWCWATPGPDAPPAAYSSPRKLGLRARQIALGERGLLALTGAETVRHVAADELWAGRSTATTLPVGAWRLLPDTGECYVAVTDSRVVCPLDTRSRRVAMDVGTRAASFDGEFSCAVRSDGSVGCRDAIEDGRLATLGDGLLAPRYREADVLGFAPVGAR